MRLALTAIAMLGVAVSAAPAFAALDQGADAPSFKATGMKGGETFTFNLDEALAKGPVVAFFFPAAFTEGCTIETKLFADAADDFAAAGATLIGVTGAARNPDTKQMLNANESLELLQKFSAETCRDKFPIAAVSEETVKAYDIVLRENISNRTSYVIAQDKSVVLAYTDSKPNEHVAKTLAAVKALKTSHADHSGH